MLKISPSPTPPWSPSPPASSTETLLRELSFASACDSSRVSPSFLLDCIGPSNSVKSGRRILRRTVESRASGRPTGHSDVTSMGDPRRRWDGADSWFCRVKEDQRDNSPSFIAITAWQLRFDDTDSGRDRRHAALRRHADKTRPRPRPRSPTGPIRRGHRRRPVTRPIRRARKS